MSEMVSLRPAGEAVRRDEAGTSAGGSDSSSVTPASDNPASERSGRKGSGQRVNILCLSGPLSSSGLRDAMQGIAGIDIRGVLVRDDKVESFRKVLPGMKVWPELEIDRPGVRYAETPLHRHYDSAVRAVLSDYRTLLLAERVYGRTAKSSAFNYAIRIEIGVWNALHVLHETSAERFVICAKPHNIRQWLLAKVAEHVGVACVYNCMTHIRSRIGVYHGIDQHTPLRVQQSDDIKANSRSMAAELVSKYKRDYASAAPELVKKREAQFKGRFWSLRAELDYFRQGMNTYSPVSVLRTLRREPERLSKPFQKYRCLQYYNRVATTDLNSSPYIALFLHYQPERITLPEGGWYCQQWYIVAALARQARKRGWRVLVKEHPSVFRKTWQPAYRSLSFYEAVAALDGAEFVALGIDPFLIIEKSKATATVAGSVVTESICRGKPVLTFGTADYGTRIGAFRIRNGDDIESALARIAEGEAVGSESEVIDYYAAMIENSCHADRPVQTTIEAYRAALSADIHQPVYELTRRGG